MKKRSGFTLAEVLITLGIIGVIAAMTIPTLLQNTNSARFAAQFKKTLSTLSQAALMGQAQYDTDFSMTRNACTVTTATSGGNSTSTESLANGDLTFCGLFNSTLAGATFYGKGSELKAKNGEPYKWNDVKALDSGDFDNMIVYALADGSIFGFNKDAKLCTVEPGTLLNDTNLKNATKKDDGTKNTDAGGLNNCIGFIDVNGTNPPNVEVSCKTDTDNKLDATKTCEVNKSGSGLGDIFPIVFHDGTVEPASPAAKTMLVQGK